MAQKKQHTSDKPKGWLSRTGAWFVDTIWADNVTVEFFDRYKLTFFVLVTIVMTSISFNYECKTQKETIDRLEHELARTVSESTMLRSLYQSRIRESNMRHYLDSLHLDLRAQEQPPCILTYR